MQDHYPSRIICLTEEPTEVLYAIGQSHRIVGISGFTVRPPQARREKPRVSAFTSARIDEILKLKPDFAIGFSDIQAGIARDLVAAGVEVWISNHRTVDGILAYVRRLGALVGAGEEADRYAESLARHISEIAVAAQSLTRRPKVYFEEWDDPQISAIEWVSELIGVAGGEDIFPNLAAGRLAKERFVHDDLAVARQQPDIILGSWCGKKFRPEKVKARPGWAAIPAVRNDDLFEIKSPIILQPGPAALTDGLSAMYGIFRDWESRRVAPSAKSKA